MPLSPAVAQAAAGFMFPEKPVEYNRRDAILYALGVGATELRYSCEEDADFAPFPTLPLVLGLKGVSNDVVPFGVESFAVPPGLDEVPISSIIHGDQSLEVFGALPVEGKGLRNRSRVIALEDKVKGALLRVETDLVAENGALLARHVSGVFLKGMGDFGGPRGTAHKREPLPTRPPDRVISLPTLPCQALLYRLSGDYNLLHVNPEFAAMVGFERPILHGLCTFAFAVRALIAAACPDQPERFRSLKGRFAAPAFPGETLEVELWDGGSGLVRLRVLATDPENGGKKREVLSDGEGRVEGGKVAPLRSRL